MPPKRKTALNAATAWKGGKKQKRQAIKESDPPPAPSTHTPTTNNTILTPETLEQLVESITNKVTEKVTERLGLTRSIPPTSSGLTGNLNGQTSGDNSSSNTNPSVVSGISSSSDLSSGGSNTTKGKEGGSTLFDKEVSVADLSLTLSNSGSSNPAVREYSFDIPLYAHVDEKIRAKIWADEFVDLARLLHPSREDNYVLAITASGENPTLTFKPQKEEKIHTIERWTRAFQVFMSVYTLKHPQEAPHMLKYCDVVRELAAKGFSWYFYDENFRRGRALDKLPWQSVHLELWVKAAHTNQGNNMRFRQNGGNSNSQQGKNAVTNSNTNSNSASYSSSPQNSNFQSFRENSNFQSFRVNPFSRTQFPKGFCFKYHGGAHCGGCNYSHTCFRCEGAHSAAKCNQNTISTTSADKRTNFNPNGKFTNSS